MKFTPLLVASERDNLEVTRVLLEQGIDVNYQDTHGHSSLYYASNCHPGINNLTQLLLDHSANANTLDK